MGEFPEENSAMMKGMWEFVKFVFGVMGMLIDVWGVVAMIPIWFIVVVLFVLWKLSIVAFFIGLLIASLFVLLVVCLIASAAREK